MDDPRAPAGRRRPAALLDRLGNSDEALRVLEQLAADFPRQPEPLTMQANILRAKHRYPEAVVAYTKALALVPADAPGAWPLYYERGIARERSHDWPGAEADFQTALKLQPDQPFVLNYLAYSWTEQGRNLPEARRMIERAAAQRPNDGAVIDSLGWVLLRQGDTAGAVKNLERAVELEPSDPTINAHLGDAYWAAGRKLEAQFQWRRALTLNPEPEDVPKLEAKLREGEQALGITPAKAVQ